MEEGAPVRQNQIFFFPKCKMFCVVDNYNFKSLHAHMKQSGDCS